MISTNLFGYKWLQIDYVLSTFKYKYKYYFICMVLYLSSVILAKISTLYHLSLIKYLLNHVIFKQITATDIRLNNFGEFMISSNF